MKQAFILFLSACLLLPAIDFFSIQRNMKKVKKEMKQRLIRLTDKEQIIVYKIKKKAIFDERNPIVYHRDDRELEIQGKMHDIVSVEEIEDFFIFHCITDEKETDLKQKLNHWLVNFFTKNISSKHNLLKFISLLDSSLIREFQIKIPRMNSTECRIDAFLYIIQYYNHIAKVPTPPPCYI